MPGTRKPKRKYNPNKRANKVTRENFLTHVTYKALYKASVSDLTENMKLNLITPLHAILTRINTDEFSKEDFIELNKGVIASWCLAKRLHTFSTTEETKGLMELIGTQAKETTELLYNVGERFIGGAEVVIDAKEKLVIGTALENYESLLNVSTSGHVLCALEESDNMVAETLERHRRAA